jgi:hypothetical protein
VRIEQRAQCLPCAVQARLDDALADCKAGSTSEEKARQNS